MVEYLFKIVRLETQDFLHDKRLTWYSIVTIVIGMMLNCISITLNMLL